MESARDSLEVDRDPVDTYRDSRDCQRLAGNTMESDIRWSLDTARYPLKTARHPLETTRLSGDCHTLWRLSDSLKTVRLSGDCHLDSLESGNNTLHLTNLRVQNCIQSRNLIVVFNNKLCNLYRYLCVNL